MAAVRQFVDDQAALPVADATRIRRVSIGNMENLHEDVDSAKPPEAIPAGEFRPVDAWGRLLWGSSRQTGNRAGGNTEIDRKRANTRSEKTWGFSHAKLT